MIAEQAYQLTYLPFFGIIIANVIVSIIIAISAYTPCRIVCMGLDKHYNLSFEPAYSLYKKVEPFFKKDCLNIMSRTI
jgi:hypothetical protein